MTSRHESLSNKGLPCIALGTFKIVYVRGYNYNAGIAGPLDNIIEGLVVDN